MEITIIYGPPGTGKTTELKKIVDTEIKNGIKPERVVFSSFTKKGTYEGKLRVMKELGVKSSKLPNFRTLHSIAFRELGVRREDIVNKEHYRMFSKELGMNFTGFYTEEFNHDDDKYLFFDILYRNNQKIGSDYLFDLDPNTLSWVRNNYKQFKKQLKLVDYTDLIEQYIKNNISLDVDIAIVDEAQDLTTLQWRMLWVAFRNCKRVYIAGDDDQAIYEWAGADINTFTEIKADKQIVLPTTYRLPSAVLHYAESIISNIEKRVSKKFVVSNKNNKGCITLVNALEEITVDTGSTWLFLARNKKFLTEVKTHLREKGIVYYTKGLPSASVQLLEAILYYERVREGGYNNKSFKLLDLIDDSCDFKDPWYLAFDMKENDISYYSNILKNGYDFENINCTVDTIHASKGAEADNVVIYTDVSNKVYRNYLENPDTEIRCWYVGITRTKNNLFIVNPRTSSYFDFYTQDL